MEKTPNTNSALKRAATVIREVYNFTISCIILKLVHLYPLWQLNLVVNRIFEPLA